jgi:hypothetical protein
VSCGAPASEGRTVYPQNSDTTRQQLVASRNRRSFEQRRQDTRQAAELPWGRACHLTERFPPTRGEEQTGVGLLYHGSGRQETLALLYAVTACREPGLVPSVGDLAWVAELGEETAVDTACARLDRAARLFLDQDRAVIEAGIEETLAASGPVIAGRHVREESWYLAAAFRVTADRADGHPGVPSRFGLPLVGVSHILDALLTIADDGHAPGTRVRVLPAPHHGRLGTIVSASWAEAGPPTSYQVQPDGADRPVRAAPADLVVLGTGTQPLGVVATPLDPGRTYS